VHLYHARASTAVIVWFIHEAWSSWNVALLNCKLVDPHHEEYRINREHVFWIRSNQDWKFHLYLNKTVVERSVLCSALKHRNELARFWKHEINIFLLISMGFVNPNAALILHHRFMWMSERRGYIQGRCIGHAPYTAPCCIEACSCSTESDIARHSSFVVTCVCGL
jgi:hypothetical protein